MKSCPKGCGFASERGTALASHVRGCNGPGQRPACGWCKRRDGTHSAKCPRGKAPPATTAGLSGHLIVPKSYSTTSPANGRAKAVRGGDQVKAPTASPLASARVALLAEITELEARLTDLRAAHEMLVRLGG